MNAKRAVIYARFSPRPHAAECESVENQLADIQRWCDAKGLPMAGSDHDKDESGAGREREGCLRALAMCKRGYVFLVRDWSRLGRDTFFNLWLFEELKKVGATLESITEGPFRKPDDPHSKFLSTVLSAVAELQRETGNLRTKAAMNRHQANGRLMGSVCPYGTMEGPPRVTVGPDGEEKQQRTLVPCPEEVEHIRRLVELHAEGHKLREIGRRMKAEGRHNRGNGWNHSTVKQILKRAGAL